MTRSFTALFFIYRNDPPNPLVKGGPEPVMNPGERKVPLFSKSPFPRGMHGGSGAGKPTN
jgi:hypothetical protein